MLTKIQIWLILLISTLKSLSKRLLINDLKWTLGKPRCGVSIVPSRLMTITVYLRQIETVEMVRKVYRRSIKDVKTYPGELNVLLIFLVTENTFAWPVHSVKM